MPILILAQPLSRKSLFGHRCLIDLREMDLLAQQGKCRLANHKVLADSAGELVALPSLIEDSVPRFG
jgi:hypothetical protein